MSRYSDSTHDAMMPGGEHSGHSGDGRGGQDIPRDEPRAVPIPTLPVPTLSFPRGRTARHVGPWLLLLTLAVAAFPAATGGFRATTAVAANAGVRPAEAGNYTVIDLGASTAGLTVSGATAYAINGNNQVVGDYYGSGGASHAFVWKPTGPSTGVMSDLGVGSGSHAYGINGRGHVVGQGAGGAYIAIPPPPGVVGPYTVTMLVPGGVAYGITNLDAVVGTSGNSAFIRTADPHDPSAIGAVKSIGAANCGSSDGRAINGSGAIVGSACRLYAADSNGSSLMSYIGSLGGRTSRAYALNESGQAGGYSYVPGNDEVHAILWDPSANGPYPTNDSTHTDLGNIGGTFATILGINDDGVSVGYGTTITGQPHAAISRLGQILGDLNDYIDPGSGYTLSHAYAINNNGVIVGDARTQDANGNPTGPTHAVLLLPPGVSLLPPPDATVTATPRVTPVGGPGTSSTPVLTVTTGPVDFTGSFLQGIPLTETVTA